MARVVGVGTHERERRLVEVAVEDVEVVGEALAVGDDHVGRAVERADEVAERCLGDVRVRREREPARAERVDDELGRLWRAEEGPRASVMGRGWWR